MILRHLKIRARNSRSCVSLADVMLFVQRTHLKPILTARAVSNHVTLEGEIQFTPF